MGLRLREGIDLARIAILGERPVELLVNTRKVAMLADQGLVALDGTRLRATDAGMPVLNAILGEVVDVRDMPSPSPSGEGLGWGPSSSNTLGETALPHPQPLP